MNKSHHSSLLNLSHQLMNEFVDEKSTRISDPFQDVYSTVESSAKLIQTPNDIRSESIRTYIASCLQTLSKMDNFSIVTTDGSSITIDRVYGRSSYRTNPNQLFPKNTTYIERIVDTKEKKEIWTYLDVSMRELDKETIPSTHITDLRNKSWYNQVLQATEPQWSSIYVSSTNDQASIAALAPLFDVNRKFIGVINGCMSLHHISEFLVSKNRPAQLAILNAKGEIVAHPSIQNTATIQGEITTLEHIDASQDDLLKKAYRLSLSAESPFTINHDQIDYLLQFRSLKSLINHDWILYLMMPTDFFIHYAEHARKKALLISAFALFASILFGFFIAYRITRPIKQLAVQADQITQLDWNQKDVAYSHIQEIFRLQVSLNHMRTSAASFGKFVPKTLVRRLMDKGQDVKIGGKNKRITLLFSDIQGFTSISEAYPPEKLIQHLSVYLEELSSIVLKQGGTIDKYIGDAIMAFWGAPQTDNNHELHACKTALLCQRQLNDLNRQWLFEKKPPLYTRIGLHTGDAIVGHIGSSERLNYTAIGDTVNLAARLEGANKYYGTYIIISAEVYKKVREDVLVRPLDIVAVKGKEEGVMIYELVALNHEPLLIPTNEQVEFCRQFNKGFDYYLDKRFLDAKVIFESLLTHKPDDQVTQLYIERCGDYIKNAPPENWNGIYHMKSK